MESLIEDMGDMTWNVVSIEEYKEVKSEDGTVYAELSDGSRFRNRRTSISTRCKDSLKMTTAAL